MPDLPKKTILLVEDDPMIARLTSNIIKNCGYGLIIAQTGEEAVQCALENSQINLIVMDINLGSGIDGTESARQILSQRSVPIIFHSAHTEQEYVDRVKQITRYGYVVKNSGDFVLASAIEMAFELFEANAKILAREKIVFASEIRYRRLFESAMDGILILDAETGMIVDVNPFLINLLGYSHELFINKTIWDIGFFKDILGNQNKFIELQKKKYVRYEHLPLETCYGKTIDVEFVSNVYEADQKKVIQCNIRDISERKSSQTALADISLRLASVLEGSNVGTWEWNINTGEIICNDLWMKMIGYTQTELTPMNIIAWERLVHPDDLENAIMLLQKNISGEIPFYQLEYRIKHKDGHWLWVLDRGRILTRSVNGQPLMMFGIRNDISGRKAIEEKLHHTAQIKDLFFSIIGHDLKNPLKATYDLLIILKEKIKDSKLVPISEILDILIASAQKNYELAENIFKWACAQSNRMSVILIKISGIKLLKSLLDKSESLRLSKNILFHFQKPTLDLEISTDLEIFETVLRNLLVNALKYTKIGGEITISLKPHNATQACISIKDNGVGIKEQDIKRLFLLNDHFTTKGTSNEQGSGFGLAMCKELITLNHGQIWAESKEGQGSTFYFTVNLSDPAKNNFPS